MSQVKISTIVPCQSINSFITQDLIPALDNQTDPDFELIIITSQKNPRISLPQYTQVFVHDASPGEKRNYGVSHAKASVVAFLDDDAFPDSNWIRSILNTFSKPKLCSTTKLAAVCGPGITPPENSLSQKISGYVWSTWIGAGGAGTYRASISPPRLVDDYPSFNLILKKSDFLKIGGFHPHYWPGEDTKLCLDIINSDKKILYHPSIKVFHHRRPILTPHLKQISRYGLHRGYFAKIHPQTSRRLKYLPPVAFFLIFATIIPALVLVSIFLPHLVPLFTTVTIATTITYLIILIITSFSLSGHQQNIQIYLLFPLTVFLTHLVYGYYFLRGYFTRRLYPIT